MILIHLITLLVIYSIANYQTLGFYFWRDDFSSFYGPLVNKCIHGWPYYGFCTTFDWIVKKIGYTPMPYFLLGNVFGFLSVVLFYLFVQKLSNKKGVALGAAGTLASSYIAAGIFLEAWDPLASYITLSILFASLVLCFESVKNGLRGRHFILAVAVLLLSVTLFNFRASTNFIPFVALIIIFAHKSISLKKRLVITTAITILSIFTFFVLPFKILNQPIDSFYPKIDIRAVITNPNKLVYLTQTFSSFLLPDYFLPVLPSAGIRATQIFIGAASLLSFAVFSLLNFYKNTGLTKIRIFAVVWAIGLFLPYWIRNDFYLNSTHRYILWMYPGILLAWSTFFSTKFWKIITLLIILSNLFFVRQFYAKHLQQSKLRQGFYEHLHSEIPALKPGSVLYFNYPPQIKPIVDDFFRVGFTPSESAIGTEFKVDYKNLKLITDSQVLSDFLQQNHINQDSFYAFYYDGEKLLNTTPQALSQVKNATVFQNYSKSPGTNKDLEFRIKNFQPILPAYLTIKMTSYSPKISIPYKQNCGGCDINVPNRDYYFRFLTASKKIKAEALIKAGGSSEDTSDQAMLDNNLDNHWLYNRQAWHLGEKPKIDLSFSHPQEIEGIILFGNYLKGLSREFQILVNGKRINYQYQRFSGGAKVIIDKQNIKKLTINILETLGNDSPVINELDFIPAGFATIDPTLSDKISHFPINKVETSAQLTELRRYLASGTKACLKWSNRYSSGEEEFTLFVNNKPYDYKIPIPALGPAETTYSISCLNFPVSLELISLQAR